MVSVHKQGAGRALDALATALRSLAMPVIGRIADDSLLLDLRCLEHPSAQFDQLVAQLGALHQALS